MTKKNVVAFPGSAAPWAERGSARLTAEHAQYLTDRGIRRSFFKVAGYRSEANGLLFPYPDPSGGFLADFGRKRLMPARDGQKFIQPPLPPRFYFGPNRALKAWCGDPEREVYFVEGETRVAAIAQHGHFVVGIGGCWNWLRKGADGVSAPIADFDLVEWTGRSVVVVFDSDVGKKRNIQLALLRLAKALETRGAVVTVVVPPDLGDGHTGADDYIAAEGIEKFLGLPRRTLDEPEFEAWGLDDDYHPTDAGNGARFAEMFGDRARYVHEWDRWIVWDAARWRPDATEEAIQLALKISRAMLREAAECQDSKEREALVAWALRSEAAPRLEATLRLARTIPPLAVTVNTLDTHPMLVGVRNGVIDLRTGERIDPDPQLLITKQVPVEFDPRAKCPTFEKFLREVMKDRTDLVAYLRRCVGYFLTGDTREQCFWIWHGIGANGKSTLLQTLLALVGEYGTSTRMETWTAHQRNAAGPSEDVARLHGVRLVSAVESEEHQRLAESLIKELTGQDKITARRLYENSFEFTPQFKLILVCNHRPIVQGDDPAIWRRLRLVPFERVFAPKDQDRSLAERLRAELPGILNWAIAGCLEWLEGGLAEPRAVVSAVDDYRSDSDVIGEFLAEEYDLAEGGKLYVAEIYARYKVWAEDRGLRYPLMMKYFSQKLFDRGFRREKDRHSRKVWVHGLKVKPKDTPKGKKF